MYAAVSSSSLRGAYGSPVTVEVHIGNGLPGFSVVGQPDEACRESRDRVRAALLSSGFPWPNRRITINLAGAGERKGGACLDLAIAVGILVATGELPAGQVDRHAFIGELGLDGAVRPTAGIAPLAHAVRDLVVVVPTSGHGEASLASRGGAVCIDSLATLVSVLRGERAWSEPPLPPEPRHGEPPDMCDVLGHAEARFALEVAAAGRHHVLMVGPPGAGKSMLASRLPGLLPALDHDRALQCALIRGAVGLPVEVPPSCVPPFRSPHHSSSLVSLVGGGSPSVRPGEISLAHNGVLFLDELSEFAPSALDALRQPLEERTVRIGRASAAVELPADFLLVAATNPCPCGDERSTECGCTPQNRHRWLKRISAPLLDRFDVRLWVPRPTAATMLAGVPGESSAVIAARVRSARQIAVDRQGCTNAALPSGRIEEHMPVSEGARRVFARALDAGLLTARGYHRARRVARTVADLRGAPGAVGAEHAEAALVLRRTTAVATGRP